jgi:hypothetical protein
MMSTTTPNMSLLVPDVGETTGPEWAEEINEDLSSIDEHDHSPGKGIKISPSGMNINVDLPFNDNNATELRSVRFESQDDPIEGVNDLTCAFVCTGDLYYTDSQGNVIRITQDGSVAGTAGSITGLSSPAAVTYSSVTKTYSFTSDINKAAAIVGADLTLFKKGEGDNSFTLKAPTLASSYSWTVPTGAPSSSYESSSNNLLPSLKLDSSGNATYDAKGSLALGSLFGIEGKSGSYIPTTSSTTADIYGLIRLDGQTVSDATSPFNGEVLRNLNSVISYSPAVTTSGGTITIVSMSYCVGIDTVTIQLSMTPSNDLCVIPDTTFPLPSGYSLGVWPADFICGRWSQADTISPPGPSGSFLILSSNRSEVQFFQDTGQFNYFSDNAPIIGTLTYSLKANAFAPIYAMRAK